MSATVVGASRLRASRRASMVVAVVPAVATLALVVWRIGRPSYWRDESVSVVIGSGPLTEWWDHVLHNADAEHGLYYLFMHLVTRFGTGEVVTRLPSASAMAAAAAGVALLGCRLLSPAAGLCAGLAFGVLPVVSRYGQEARSYALICAAVVLATAVLLRALGSDGRGGVLRWYTVYGLVMGIAGWLHLYALLVLPAHAVTVVLMARGGPGRRHVLAFGLAASAVSTAVAPLLVMAIGFRDAWPSPARPGLSAVLGFAAMLTGERPTFVVVGVLVSAAILPMIRTTLWPVSGTAIRTPWPGGSRPRADGGELLAVALPLLLVPFTVAVLASQITPTYRPRYVLSSVVGLALLCGAGVTVLVRAARRRLPRADLAVPLLAVTVLAASTVPTHLALRQPDSRPDDLRALADVLRREGRAGDAVLQVPWYREAFTTVYADAFAPLDSTTLRRPSGEDLPPERFAAALDDLQRIWVVESRPPYLPFRTPAPARNLALLRADARFTPAEPCAFGGIRLTLFARTPGDARSSGRPVDTGALGTTRSGC